MGMNNERDNDTSSATPMLDQAEHDSALLQLMATKVQLYSLWVAHLLIRLEAVSPESAIFMSPKHMKLATGLPLMIGDPGDGKVALFIECDNASVEYVGKDEMIRRQTNGIGQAIATATGPGSQQGSGIVNFRGQELPSTKRKPDAGPDVIGAPGEVS